MIDPKTSRPGGRPNAGYHRHATTLPRDSRECYPVCPAWLRVRVHGLVGRNRFVTSVSCDPKLPECQRNALRRLGPPSRFQMLDEKADNRLARFRSSLGVRDHAN